MFPYWFFPQHKGYPTFKNSKQQYVPSTYLITNIFERIVNIWFLCLPVSASFLDHRVWSLIPTTLLNLAGLSAYDFYSSSFSSFQVPFFHPPLPLPILRILPHPPGLSLLCPLSLGEL